MDIFFYLDSLTEDDFRLRSAVLCARRLSGLQVKVISKHPIKCDGWFDTRDVEKEARLRFPKEWKTLVEENHYPQPWRASAVRQWFALSCCITEPTLVLDWDVVVSDGLEIPLSAFSNYQGVVTTSGFVINDQTLIDDFLRSSTTHRPSHTGIMDLWLAYYQREKSGGLLRLCEESDPYFDFNMHTHTKRWQSDPSIIFDGKPSKLLVWNSEKPHFVEAGSGKLYPAWIIHCWGAWKSRQEDLVKRLIGDD